MLVVAETGCTLRHLLLSDFEPDEKCGDGLSTSAKWTCCGKQPDGCGSGYGGSGQYQCIPDAVREATLAQTCGPDMELYFGPDEKCGPGSSDAYTYTCCPKPGAHDAGPADAQSVR
jgi:hypothetical protein